MDTQHEIEKTILAKIVALGQERVRSYLQKALRIVKEYLNESGEFPSKNKQCWPCAFLER